MKKQIIALSKSSGIPCIYTAFLCIEKRTDPITRQLYFERVPAVLPADVHLRNRLVQTSTPNYRSNGARRSIITRQSVTIYPQRSAKSSCCGGGGGGGNHYEPHPVQQPRKQVHQCVRSSVVSKDTATEVTKNEPLLMLLEKQQAEGFWTIDAVPTELESMRNPPQSFTDRYSTNTATLWATLLLVVYLSTKYSDREGEWRLIALKARKWLRAAGLAVEDFSPSLTAQLLG